MQAEGRVARLLHAQPFAGRINVIRYYLFITNHSSGEHYFCIFWCVFFNGQLQMEIGSSLLYLLRYLMIEHVRHGRYDLDRMQHQFGCAVAITNGLKQPTLFVSWKYGLPSGHTCSCQPGGISDLQEYW